MTCSTCRFLGAPAPLTHWADDDDTVRESAHHRCVRIIHGNGDAAGPQSLTEPAVVTDGSGYAASLRVLPTFGCSLWEGKT